MNYEIDGYDNTVHAVEGTNTLCGIDMLDEEEGGPWEAVPESEVDAGEWGDLCSDCQYTIDLKSKSPSTS